MDVAASKNRKFMSRAFWATIVSPEGLKYAHCMVQLLLKRSMADGVFFMYRESHNAIEASLLDVSRVVSFLTSTQPTFLACTLCTGILALSEAEARASAIRMSPSLVEYHRV